MPNLYSVLSQAAASLGAHRAASATASHNLANANTPGYSRQSANIVSVHPSDVTINGQFIGRGAMLGTVTQARDRFVESQLTSYISSGAQSEARAQSLTGLSAFDTETPGGIGAGLGAFYGSLRALSQNPADVSLRSGVTASAKSLALAFNQTSQQIAGSRSGIDERLRAIVPEVNQLTKEMASLNQQILTARGTGAEPNDLLDKRQVVQDRLAELTGAVPIPTREGDVNLSLPNGAGALVTGAYAAEVVSFPDGTNGGHLALHLRRTDGSLSGKMSDSFGGTLGGLLESRDVTLLEAQQSIDTLAYDVTTAMNTVHSAGYALDGTTGRDLFDVGATVEGAARRMTANAEVMDDPRLLAGTTDPAQLPGAGDNFQALLGTETQALSTGLDPGTTLSAITGSYGVATKQALSMAEHDASMRSHLTGMREAVSGVSIDEEILKLTQSQRGYEAVLKVITTADEMMENLLNLR